MSLNENGLYRAGWTVTDNYKQINQGEVVGIAFGWIVAVILFYIVGVIIIIKCIPVRRAEQDESQKENGGSKEKEGKSSLQKESKVQQQFGKRRRKIQESFPTSLELAQSQKPSDFIKSFNIMTNNAATGREQ